MKNLLIKNYKFNKGQDEKIIFQLRKHWVILAFSFFKVFLSFLLFSLALYFVGFSRIFNSYVWAIIFGVWFLITLVYGFYEWLVWYLYLYFLTKRRVVDIEQKTLFIRSVSETNLDKIQDVTFEIRGFLATLFSFGNVKIETAGKETVITLDQVKNSEELQKIIFDAQKEYNKIKIKE